jgi:hypothetical protein
MDLGVTGRDRSELAAWSRQRLETDEPRLRPACAGIDGELSLVGADVDDGRKVIAPKRDIMIEGGGNTLRECRPTGRAGG